MKKTFIFSILFVLFSVGALFAQTTDPNEELDFSVEIKPASKPLPSIKPRTIVDDDINAYYSHGELSFMFNVDLGNAYIVVTNASSGEFWYESLNGVDTTTLTLSGDEGYYEIYIDTDRGEYTGAFVI